MIGEDATATTGVPLHDEGEEYAPSSNGVWAGLRKQHQAVSEAREPLTLEVPGYEGLWVRYRYVPLSGRNKKALAKVQELKDVSDQKLWASVDLLRDTVGVTTARARIDPRADTTGLAPLCDPGEPAIKFDRILARGMEWSDADLLGARQIVRRLFGDEEGDYVLIAHAEEVSVWMGKEREALSEEFAGK